MTRPSAHLLAVAAASLFGAVACAGSRSGLDQLPAQELAGHFTGGAGGSWFLRCGAAPSDSAWWVTFTDRAVVQRDSLRRTGQLPDDQRRFVRWQAAITEGGEVGPRGPGVPALLVRDILMVRVPAANDCAP